MQTAWRPDPAALAGRLRTAAGAELTYPVGYAASDGRWPPGFVRLRRKTPVGRGATSWQRVADALMCWELHREAGMVLASTGSAVEVGCTVVNAAPVGPVALLAPCRVVAVIDEPSRRGFAYGTLPGHPLTGEEQFAVELDDDGTVTLEIRSFSAPVGLARVAPPIARAGQRMVNRRYAAAARRLAG